MRRTGRPDMSRYAISRPRVPETTVAPPSPSDQEEVLFHLEERLLPALREHLLPSLDSRIQAGLQILEAERKRAEEASPFEPPDGDTVTLVKDLKLGGGLQVLKAGTKAKNIRLVDGDHEIACKIEGSPIALKACFVKKA